jgi:ribosomal-protein-alanine N-acetyltransferase
MAFMNKLIIRDMREDDIHSIMEIENISFSSPWSEEFFLVQIYAKYAVSKIALFEGKVIGYITANYEQHESSILNLAVHPDYRRCGVGTLLMNATMKEVKNKSCVFMYLKVRTSNTTAQKFYERFGFTVEAVRKKYYGNPDEDALQMMGRL